MGPCSGRQEWECHGKGRVRQGRGERHEVNVKIRQKQRTARL